MKHGYPRIIGSGAAEAIPSPMCLCPVCETARRRGGKDIRSRSCLRVSPGMQIDFGPDQFYQSWVLGNDLTGLTDILVTHTHADHLALAEFDLRALAVSGAAEPVTVHASREGCRWIERALALHSDSALSYPPCYHLAAHPYFESFRAGGLDVTLLRGNHRGYGEGEDSANYLIRLNDGKMLFYAVDTGYFLEETFEFLNSAHLDILVLDGTFGAFPRFQEERASGHLGFPGVLAVVRRLLSQGTLEAGAMVCVTHISHRGGMCHNEMQAFYDAQGTGVRILVGFDGMELTRSDAGR